MSRWLKRALLAASIIALAATGVDAAPKAAKEQSQSEAPKISASAARPSPPKSRAGTSTSVPTAPACPRQGHGEAGRSDLHAAMRGLPRRVRRKRRALAYPLRRRQDTCQRRSGQIDRLILALLLDADRLHPPRHAVRQRAVANQRRTLRRHRLRALPQRHHQGRKLRAERDNVQNRSSCRTRRIFATTTATPPRRRCGENPCMADCLPGPAKITGRARAIDVTPEPGKGPKVEYGHSGPRANRPPGNSAHLHESPPGFRARRMRCPR